MITITLAASCRSCGCTQERACFDELSGHGCYWEEKPEDGKPGLCNVCARTAAPRRVIEALVTIGRPLTLAELVDETKYDFNVVMLIVTGFVDKGFLRFDDLDRIHTTAALRTLRALRRAEVRNG